MSEDPTRITVSRDALRADLAEMELRLRIYFDAQLHHKADVTAVVSMATRLDKLERGDFTAAQRGAIDKQIREARTKESSNSWTARSRLMGVISLSIAVFSVAISFLSFHGGFF